MTTTLPTAFRLPPLDTSLLFPDLINFHIEKNPSVPLYVYPNEHKPGSTTEITFLEFGRAAHRVAHVLRPGRHGPEGQVVMLIATTDTLLHHAVLAGMSIAGLVPFPVSPRNSPAAIADMMAKTNCVRILTLHHAHQSLIDGIRHEVAHRNGATFVDEEIPTLAYAFPNLVKAVASDNAFDPYPPPSARPDLDATALYIHSSGSTGFPKPIAHSYRIQINWMALIGSYDYFQVPTQRCVGPMSLPPFHIYGITCQLYIPLARIAKTALFPPRTLSDPHAAPVIPTGDTILECIKQTQCEYVTTVPAFVDQWAASEDAIEVLKKLDCLVYGGGSLPEKIGDALCAAGVPIGSGYGGTEFGVVALPPTRVNIADGDWQWLSFPETLKLRWDPQGDGTYECQVLTIDSYHTAVQNLPDVPGYATSDLFIKHPTKKDVWKIIGRKDDVIVLASGEKTVPAPMESIIESGPLIQGAVIFGRVRNQVGILVEPREGYDVDTADEKAVAEFRNKIWPLVEEANKTSPAFSRIFKEMILVTSRGKPMARTGKSTVQKKATLNEYEPEIDALYDAVESSSQARSGPSSWSGDELEAWLKEQASAISSDRDINPTADLFAQGFDSLSATYLRNRILGAMRASLDPHVQKGVSRVSPNLVFEQPTITILAAHIAGLVSQDGTAQATDVKKQHVAAIDATIAKYSVGLVGNTDGSLPGRVTGPQAKAPTVVLLTGSTGGLGSFLLAQLLENPAVERVYALNRPSSSSSIEARQRSAFVDRGLPVKILESKKLLHVEADASQDKCGLPPAVYDEIRGSVTVIIHNAWRLDFNLTLSSFESSIQSTRNLVDLGLDSPQKHNIRFLFTSSISTAYSWDRRQGPYPEEVQLDSALAVGSGYGESKYVSERIITKSGLRATSLRIGQIAGGPNGSWATTDWVPNIVKSSIGLGAFPEAIGVVSWLRPEEVAAAIIEVAFSNEPPPALNIVNPRNSPWVDVIVSVRDTVAKELELNVDQLPILSFAEWFDRLERKAESASSDDLNNIPAIKLLEFFRIMSRSDQASRGVGLDPANTEAGGFVNFSTRKVQTVSETMARMQAVGEAEARLWVGYWRGRRFF